MENPTPSPRTPRHDRPPGRGGHLPRNALEWYDFSVYAFFAMYIGQAVFRHSDGGAQTLQRSWPSASASSPAPWAPC